MNFNFIIFSLAIFTLNKLNHVMSQDAVELPPIDDEPTEPPITTAVKPVIIDCSAVCEAKLADAMTRIDTLEFQLHKMNITVLERIRNLETDYYNVLSEKVSVLQTDLTVKTTELNTQLKTEIKNLDSSINKQVDDVEARFTKDIAALKTELVQGPLEATKMELTKAISTLETGKVQTLVRYNELWKRNFRIFNNSITRIQRRLNLSGTNFVG